MSEPAATLPTLTIGLCTFNRGRRIVETLDAIMRMDHVGGGAGGRVAGLIVVDNNSTDETGMVVEKFALVSGAFPVRRVVETVQGIGAARARFMREAAGTGTAYLAMLDDDCLPDPGWAAAMIDVLDRHPDAGWVGGKIDLQWESGPTRLAERCRTMLAHQDFGEAERPLEKMDQGMASAAFAARRGALEATGWLSERLLGGREGGSLESGEDYEMCIRLRLAGWKVWYTPRAKVRHMIPAQRQKLEYLERLARGVSLSKAQLKWLAMGKPDVRWAKRHLSRARARQARARMLEWRPGIRRLKLAEHSGRVESWERLVRMLGRSEPGSASPGR